MKKIYILNGLPESGKTTFGNLVADSLAEKGITFLHTSSINLVKDVLKPIHLWPEELTRDVATKITLMQLKTQIVGSKDWDGITKDGFWRKAMSELKLLINSHDKFFINETILKQFDDLGENWVGFVDIRENQSISDFISHAENFGYRVEKILVRSDKEKPYENFSDMDVMNTKYDIVIDNPRIGLEANQSLELLKSKVISFIEKEVLEKRSKERFY